MKRDLPNSQKCKNCWEEGEEKEAIGFFQFGDSSYVITEKLRFWQLRLSCQNFSFSSIA